VTQNASIFTTNRRFFKRTTVGKNLFFDVEKISAWSCVMKPAIEFRKPALLALSDKS